MGCQTEIAKSLQTIVKIESERFVKSTQKTQTSKQYYISSLSCDAEKIANAIRPHWKIENILHWHLDVSFNENSSRKRFKNAAQNFSSVLKLFLKLLKNETTTTEKKSIRRK